MNSNFPKRACKSKILCYLRDPTSYPLFGVPYQKEKDLVASSPIPHQPKNYDAFLSFRGEDTRDNFVSHLFSPQKVESWCLDASDVSVVGICGMGGLGKTTIAGAVFDRLQNDARSHLKEVANIPDWDSRVTWNLDDATKDLMMAKILGAAGALRGRDVAAKKLQESNREAHLESRKPPRFAFQHHSNLVAATLLLTTTFLAALRPSSELLKVELINSSQTGKQGTPITDLFVLFNSTAFISLIVLIFSITQKLSVQPWFPFVEFSIVGAYVCSVMVVTPHLVAAVLLIGGFILLVACFKFLGFHKMVLKWLQWPCTKVQSERKSTAPDAYLPLVSNIH